VATITMFLDVDLIVETLGGARTLHARPATPEALRDCVRAGLPYPALEAVAGRLALTRDEVVRVVGLPHRTLARRKAERRLRATESDRLFRLSRIAALAEETLGTAERAGRWLRAPNRALGHETPLDLLDTDLGARQIEAVIGRIAHGVHS
jgi:putative toxin-antitoxin system antitoxin component (TIGR02293 family)